MRIFLVGLIASVGVAAATIPVEAKKPMRHAKTAHSVERHKVRDGDSSKCIEAQANDPGGNFASYPCWAQAAFGPRRIGR